MYKQRLGLLHQFDAAFHEIAQRFAFQQVVGKQCQIDQLANFGIGGGIVGYHRFFAFGGFAALLVNGFELFLFSLGNFFVFLPFLRIFQRFAAWFELLQSGFKRS